MKAEAEKLQALAALDSPTGEPSKWIVDLRASFRYIIISFKSISGIFLYQKKLNF